MLTCLQKIPFVGNYFVNEVPPEDNVCFYHIFQYYLFAEVEALTNSS